MRTLSRGFLVLDAVQLGVDTVERQQVLMSAVLRDHAVLEDDDVVGVADGARRCAMVITVRPFMSRSKASTTRCSDSLSSAAVGSSRIRIGLSRMIARAMPIRCRWPPESERPRSPTALS
jgi:hypothetical protein